MVKNCYLCGSLTKNKSGLCDECKEENQHKLRKIKDFLWEHPNSTVKKIHNKTGVEEELIRKYIREDKFIISNILEIDD
ncbi:flagellar protein [Halanaerobium praevalens]|uniref:Flagellar protein n=1 Tax=Halanaerobium praevalens (strain ATCC 33744 / DSM 2228 / GSL) TaxID=572479 RepID=E3DQZ9_HALPG|nr:flagellar protein [Halanaerobium praevalens]ADO77988.1 flagellar protein [Halanaerobium praevalens DSM 2228]